MFSVMVHMLYILLTLLARIACIAWNAGYCYRRRDVDWFVFVCPFGTLASPAKTGEPIEMPSERGQTCVGQRNRVLYCTKVHTGATWRIQWNNLYDGDDEGYRYHYCSNLLSMFSFFSIANGFYCNLVNGDCHLATSACHRAGWRHQTRTCGARDNDADTVSAFSSSWLRALSPSRRHRLITNENRRQISGLDHRSQTAHWLPGVLLNRPYSVTVCCARLFLPDGECRRLTVKPLLSKLD